MKKSEFYLGGIKYKSEQRVSIIILMTFVISGLLEYYRAISLGLSAQENTFFDVYIWNMGNPINLIFIQTIIYILIISRFVIIGEEDIYFIIHKKSKHNIAVINILSIIFVTIVLAVGHVLVAFFLTLHKHMFSSEISEFLRQYFTEIQNVSVLKISTGLFLNTTMYFLCLGLLYYICLYCNRKKIVPYISLFILVALNYILYLCKINFRKATFLSNIFPVYSYEILNTSFNSSYWMVISGMLIILAYFVTIKTDVIKTKKFFCIKRIKKILMFCKNRFFFFLFFMIAGITFFFLSYKHFIFSGRGKLETLALFFSGSNQLDVRYLLWLFLELVISLYISNIVFWSQKYNAYIRAIRLKSKDGYIKYLIGIMVLGTLLAIMIIIACVFLLLNIVNHDMGIVNNRVHLYSNKYVFFIINYILSLIVFNLWVGVSNLFLNNISISYLTILVVQSINFVLYNLFGSITKCLPMIHGCTFLFSVEFTWLFGLVYQLLEVFLLITIFSKKMKKSVI